MQRATATEWRQEGTQSARTKKHNQSTKWFCNKNEWEKIECENAHFLVQYPHRHWGRDQSVNIVNVGKRARVRMHGGSAGVCV